MKINIFPTFMSGKYGQESTGAPSTEIIEYTPGGIGKRGSP
jgi:hypothetical protein